MQMEIHIYIHVRVHVISNKKAEPPEWDSTLPYPVAEYVLKTQVAILPLTRIKPWHCNTSARTLPEPLMRAVQSLRHFSVTVCVCMFRDAWIDVATSQDMCLHWRQAFEGSQDCRLHTHHCSGTLYITSRIGTHFSRCIVSVHYSTLWSM